MYKTEIYKTLLLLLDNKFQSRIHASLEHITVYKEDDYIVKYGYITRIEQWVVTKPHLHLLHLAKRFYLESGDTGSMWQNVHIACPGIPYPICKVWPEQTGYHSPHWSDITNQIISILN